MEEVLEKRWVYGETRDRKEYSMNLLNEASEQNHQTH